MRSLRRLFLIIPALTLVIPAKTVAQLCYGNPSFRRSPVQVAVNVGLDRFAQRYTAELRYGASGFFAAAEAGIKIWRRNSLNAESDALGVVVGLQLPRKRDARLELCPMLSFTALFGPDQVISGLWEYGEKSFAVGLSGGYLLARTKLWQVMPTGALTLGTSNPRLTTAYGGNMANYQGFCCGRRSFTTLRFGVGLGFGPQFTASPSVSVPLGEAGATVYGVRVAVRMNR